MGKGDPGRIGVNLYIKKCDFFYLCMFCVIRVYVKVICHLNSYDECN